LSTILSPDGTSHTTPSGTKTNTAVHTKNNFVRRFTSFSTALLVLSQPVVKRWQKLRTIL
jgi:hypothetical protein